MQIKYFLSKIIGVNTFIKLTGKRIFVLGLGDDINAGKCWNEWNYDIANSTCCYCVRACNNQSCNEYFA